MKPLAVSLVALGLAAAAPSALAHGDPKPGAGMRAISTEEHPWGREGHPAKARHTVTVDMSDDMRFTPEKLTVKRGDTVRFVVRNSGKLDHEMVIGTRQELEKHAEMMKKHPGMEHDEPYQAHVKPGASQSMAWTFTNRGTFMYGCLYPGHWDAGMKGTIVVTD